MAFPAALSAWSYRKKITVPSGAVSADLTNFPVAVRIDTDSDVQAGMNADASDLRVTASDGETLLDHETITRGTFPLQDGVWTWFCKPVSVYHNSALYVTALSAYNGVGQNKIAKYDYATHELSMGMFSGPGLDDHNNAAIVVRNDGRLIVFYAGHGIDDQLRWRISTSPEDVTSWGSEQTDTDSAISPSVTYSVAFRLTGEGGDPDGRIYHFYRSPITQWRMRYSDDSGATWSTKATFLAGGNRPYPVFCWNGVDRFDLVWASAGPTDANPSQGIWHIYYDAADGLYHNSDGSLVAGDGILPSGGWSSADVNSSSVVLDLSAGTDTCWTANIDYQANGNVAAVVYQYPAGAGGATGVDYVWCEWTGSAWSTETITEAARITSANDYYHGGAAVDRYRNKSAYLGVAVTGVVEIQRWSSSGSWSKSEDMTTGSVGQGTFRPYLPEGHPGAGGGLVVACSGLYDGFLTVSTGLATGIRAMPSLMPASQIYFRAPSLATASDNEFYLYYGNAAATDAQNVGGVWADYIHVWHFHEDDSNPKVLPDSIGGNHVSILGPWDHGQTLQGTTKALLMEMDSATYFVAGAGWGRTTSPVDMALLNGCCFECFAWHDGTTGDEHKIFVNDGGTNPASLWLRVDPATAPDSLQWYWFTSAGFWTAGATSDWLANTPEYIAANFDGTIAEARGQVGAAIESITGSVRTLNTSASTGLAGVGGPGTVHALEYLHGGLAEMRISAVSRSDAWRNATRGNFSDASFLSVGAQETSGSGILFVAAAYYHG